MSAWGKRQKDLYLDCSAYSGATETVTLIKQLKPHQPVQEPLDTLSYKIMTELSPSVNPGFDRRSSVCFVHTPSHTVASWVWLQQTQSEWEVKGALERITTNKASGGEGIPVELFQILKDDAVKVLHSICKLEIAAVATGLEKVSFHSNPKERQCQRMLKWLHNCTHLTH